MSNHNPNFICTHSLADLCVAAGTYTYPFECQLPVEVPSSIETDVGAIKYVANLVLDRPSWQIPTPDFLFTVIKPFDLSTDFSVHVCLKIDFSFVYVLHRSIV